MIDAQVKPAFFVEAVLLRPTIYTRGGTFVEVIAFLEGYYSGVAKGAPYAPPVMEWEAFRGWIAEQICVEASEIFSVFQTRYASDGTALTKLADCFARFQAGEGL